MGESKPLTIVERTLLLNYGRFLKFEQGETILGAGSEVDGIYLVFKGLVLLAPARRSLGAECRRTLSPGQLFGQSIPGVPEISPYRARALEESTLIHIDSQALSRLMHEHLALGTRLLLQQQQAHKDFEASFQASDEQGLVVALYGPRGGAGTTTAAITLAGLAAEFEMSTLLIDLHPFFGEVAPLCEWRPEFDLASLLEGPLTADQLSLCVRTGRQFDVLAAPRRFEDGERLDPTRLPELLRLAAQEYALVLVDLPEAVSEVVLAGLEVADQILLTLTADFEGLLAGRRVRELLEKLGIPEDVLWVMLNRFRGSGGITPQQLRDMLGWSTAITAEDSGQLLHLANDGRLWEVAQAMPQHPLVSACRYVLRRMTGLHAGESTPPPEIYMEERTLLPAPQEDPGATPYARPAPSQGWLARLFLPLLSFLGLT